MQPWWRKWISLWSMCLMHFSKQANWKIPSSSLLPTMEADIPKSEKLMEKSAGLMVRYRRGNVPFMRVESVCPPSYPGQGLKRVRSAMCPSYSGIFCPPFMTWVGVRHQCLRIPMDEVCVRYLRKGTRERSNGSHRELSIIIPATTTHQSVQSLWAITN